MPLRQCNQPAKKTLRQVNLQSNSETRPTAWKMFRSTESVGKTLSELLRYLQPVQCEAGARFCELLPLLGHALVMQLTFSYFCSCKQPFILFFVSNHNKIHRCWNLMLSILWFITHSRINLIWVQLKTTLPYI